MATPLLELYVSGHAGRAARAIADLRRLCAEALPGAEVVVIDVLVQPRLAERAGIVATPTLVLASPAAALQRRFTGDLSDAARVLVALGLDAAPAGDARSPGADGAGGPLRHPPGVRGTAFTSGQP